jgi:prepilin-type N-terminal cleavage/methylation domain-containing protein
MKTTLQSRRLRAQRGFSLIEAMIALLVMAFGMLALSGMQLSLSRNADVAKQRSEAMRIAQERIEIARSYTSLAASGGIDWTNLVADVAAPATVTANTNATFNVVVTAGGAVTDAARTLQVAVNWTDRANDPQSVSLVTVVSKNDPKDPGFLGNPLPNTVLKRPKNRNINIPIPALDLGGGRSATQFDVNYVIVYSNITAGVVQICDPVTAGTTATVTEINDALANTYGTCVDVAGYIVAGYVGRTSTSVNFPTGMTHGDVIRNTAHATQGVRCLYADATDQGNGTLITADNGYKYYVCVVPLESPFTWSGTVRLGGVLTSGDYIVCRYQYTQTNITANERNVQPYAGVNMSMDEQNYLVTTSSSATCPSSMTVAGVSVGVLHQDCRSSNTAGYLATNCPAPSPP